MTTKSSPVRVILVDDHQMLLELLADTLAAEPGIKVAGAFTSGLEAVKAVKTTPCDVVVMDLLMPGITGLECAKMLRREAPEAGILVVSGNSNPIAVSQALQLGVKGYLEKSCSTKQITEAIRAIAAGKTYFGQSLQPTLKRLHNSPFPLDAANRLSARERTVLAGIAAGRTSKVIASQLGLSDFTVKNHRRRIKGKTGLQTNAEMILLATRLGLVEPDSI